MSKIIVIGSSNTDLVVRSERIPRPGETLLGGNFFMAGGGKGANQAVAASRLGGDVVFVAALGDDMFGRGALEAYKAEKMDISRIEILSGTPSGVATIIVDTNAENSIVVAPGANSCLSTESIDRILPDIKKDDIVLLQLETPLPVVEYAARKCAEKGCRVVLNPAPAAQLPTQMLSALHLITPNETEAELLSGIKIEREEDIRKAARTIQEKGVKNVIITLGAQGAFVLSDEIAGIVPGEKVVAVDTTAAGDTFNGALCVSLVEGGSLLEAVKFATKAAAKAVTRLGAQPSIPYRNEIK